jgi:hypothetical protein
MLKPGDHIVYHRNGFPNRNGFPMDLKCILIDRVGDNFYKIRLKVNHQLGISKEVVWSVSLPENESIVLDKEYYRDIKLNTLLGDEH